MPGMVMGLLLYGLGTFSWITREIPSSFTLCNVLQKTWDEGNGPYFSLAFKALQGEE